MSVSDEPAASVLQCVYVTSKQCKCQNIGILPKWNESIGETILTKSSAMQKDMRRACQ